MQSLTLYVAAAQTEWELELTVSSSRPVVIDNTLICRVQRLDKPLMLHVQAEIKVTFCISICHVKFKAITTTNNNYVVPSLVQESGQNDLKTIPIYL